MSEVMERTESADRGHDTVSGHQEGIRAIEPAVADNLSLLLPLDRAWQPTDDLPDLEMVSWRDKVEGFRTAAETVSDELLVVLAGDMVAEEGRLNDPRLRENFVERVFAYRRLTALCPARWSMGAAGRIGRPRSWHRAGLLRTAPQALDRCPSSAAERRPPSSPARSWTIRP
jgi:hypothetical protein